MSIQVKQISLQNHETYTYREVGEGNNVIVLIHGNLATSLFYVELMQELAQHSYRVLAVDLRGFGGSTYHRPIDTLRDFAGDLKLLVDALGVSSFDLLGWSTGGAISMYFTSMYPRYIKRLFLVGSAGVSGYHSYRIEADGSKTQLISKKQMQEDKTKTALLKMMQTKDEESYKKVWNAAIYNKKQPQADVYHQQLVDSMKQQNLIDVYYALSKFNISDYYNGLSVGSEEVKNIKVPTTMIYGEDDQLVSVAEAKHLQENIGEHAKLVVVKECGHSPMVDALDVLVNAIVFSKTD